MKKYLKRLFLGPIAQLSVVDLIVISVILGGLQLLIFGAGLIGLGILAVS